MVKKARTAAQSQKALAELNERVLAQFQLAFDAKGYELVKYLDGEIDQPTSDTVRKVFLRAHRQAERALAQGKGYEPNLKRMMKTAGVSVVWMSDDAEVAAVPDWVVKQTGKRRKTYAALIETTLGNIEVSDSAIAQEVEELAQKWEDERKVFAADPAFDHDHFDFAFSEEVTIVANY